MKSQQSFQGDMWCWHFLCTNLFVEFFFFCLLGMSRKPSWACENIQPSPQHQPKASEMNGIVIHFEYVPSTMWHLEILPWYASGIHYEYVARQVTLEADIPLQQLSTHQMSISWMKICYNQKDESGLFSLYEIYLCFFRIVYCYFLAAFGETITNPYPCASWRNPWNLCHP